MASEFRAQFVFVEIDLHVQVQRERETVKLCFAFFLDSFSFLAEWVFLSSSRSKVNGKHDYL